MRANKLLKSDLREAVEKKLGKPMAASLNASLWRCPVCPPEAHSLLMVSADQHRCLGRFACDGGVSKWMQSADEESDISVGAGVST